MAITNTEEAIKAGGAIYREAKLLTADGFQFSDVTAFVNKINTDPAFAKIVADGLEGLSQIPVELKTVGLLEGWQLLQDILNELNDQSVPLKK